MGRIGKFLKDLISSTGTISGGGSTQPTVPGASMTFKEGWVSPSRAGELVSPETDPPKVKLRYNIRKNAIDTFITLAVSTNGDDASGSGYNVLVGGVGAGLPESFLNIGSPSGTPLTIAGDTVVLKEVAQLFNPPQLYPFDLASPTGLQEFITNECLAAQLMLGPLQNGKLTLKSWVHEEAAVVTLSASNGKEVIPVRFPSLKRLNMTFGFNPIDLSPQFARAFRWFGASNVKPEQTQSIRLFVDGVTSGQLNASSPYMEKLLRVFYKMLGGSPFTYPVTISLEDFINNGLEFGDSVNWSDPKVVTPTGVGISSVFFIIGVDVKFETGEVNLLLLENKLTSTSESLSVSNHSPAWKVAKVFEVSSTEVYLDLIQIGTTGTPDPDNEFDGLMGTMVGAGYWFEVSNYDQSPPGDLEQTGAVLAHCLADASFGTKLIGDRIRIKVTCPAPYHRGAITRASDLFIPGETVLQIPTMQTASQNLNATLIEPNTTVNPGAFSLTNLQPPKSFTGGHSTLGA